MAVCVDVPVAICAGWGCGSVDGREFCRFDVSVHDLYGTIL